jgi:tripartite-type tricarboxylate transporter receptor subunit TctC
VSPGVGSHGQLVSEFFASEAGIRLQHVPHKGSSPAMLDLIAGNVKVGTMTWTSAASQIRAGKIVPLAVSSSHRVAEYPDLPTFKELGYPNIVTTTWYALSGPAGLPDEIVARLNGAVLQMLELPAVKTLYAKDAIEVAPMTPAEVTAYMASEIEKWGPIAKKLAQ